MRVVVTNEQRYVSANGGVWSASGGYDFYARYLSAFDEVIVVARVGSDREVGPGWHRVDGPGVRVAPVPYYIGPKQFLRVMRSVRKQVMAAVGPRDAIVARLDSQIAAHLLAYCRRVGRPYGAEVVVDPLEVFVRGSGYPLPSFWRWWFPRALRTQVRHAAACAYVTERALQDRYPPDPRAFTTHYSSVELQSAWYTSGPRTGERVSDRQTLVTVGNLDHLYKGQDLVIRALATPELKDVVLTLVGDGARRNDLVDLAARLRVAERVEFRGIVPHGPELQRILDEADLYVLPSRGEGLPRSLLEGMARGMPAIATSIRGASEVLDRACLVPINDAAALARAIRRALDDPSALARMSAQNLARAKDFGEDRLQTRRLAFYQATRDATSDWLSRSS